MVIPLQERRWSEVTRISSSLNSPLAAPGVEPHPSPEILGGLFRMTVAQYERMVESGALDGLPGELIAGLLVRIISENHRMSSLASRFSTRSCP